jgi:hypothetical protein
MKAILESDESEPVTELVDSVLAAPPELQFRLDHAYSIADGIKTQTSRLLRPDELETLSPGVTLYANIWEPRFAELEVVTVASKRLGDFTEEDARREGGYNLEQFKKVWESIHGEDCIRPMRDVKTNDTILTPPPIRTKTRPVTLTPWGRTIIRRRNLTNPVLRQIDVVTSSDQGLT